MDPVRFSVNEPEVIVRWVLECPFLQWRLDSVNLPELRVKRADGQEAKLQIRGILGRGGFGVVMEATDGDAVFAVKVPMVAVPSSAGKSRLADEIAGLLVAGSPGTAMQRFDTELGKAVISLQARLETAASIQQARKFRRESLVLQRLNHPNVVALRFIGEITVETTEQRRSIIPCLGMELISGTSVQRMILRPNRNLKDELPEILRVCRDAALAIASMHDMQVCHRDVSWNNIMIQDSGTTTIIDLGNVNDPDGSLETLRQLIDEQPEVGIVFTPGFVAPEVIDFWRPSSASDQFSLGVLLYVWCCRGAEWPYKPRPIGAFSTLNPKNPDQPIPLLERLQGELGRTRKNASENWTPVEKTALRRLSGVVDRMLQKQEGNRFPSMRDVAAELQSLIVDSGYESYQSFDVVELVPVDDFIELCRQVNFTAPSASHGCLFLQMMVRQARLQISRSIDHIWATLFDTFHGSADLSSLEGMRTAVDQVDRMLNDLNISLRVVLLAFGATRSEALLKPRFGGRLQNLLGQVKEYTAPLIRHTRSSTKLLKEILDSTADSSASAEEQNRLQQLHQQAAEEIRQLWNLVSGMQIQLAGCDFDLAVYTMRLRRVLVDSQKSP